MTRFFASMALFLAAALAGAGAAYYAETSDPETQRAQAEQLLLAERVGDLLLMHRGVHETVSDEIDRVDTSSFDFKADEPKVEDLHFERPLCYGFNPQSKSLWGRCRSPDNRFRGTQTVDDSPEMLQQKRRQLEEDQRRVAEELRRLEEQSSRPDE